MRNNFHKARPSEVLQLGTNMADIIPSTAPNAWGTSVDQAAALDACKDNLEETIRLYTETKALLASYRIARDAATNDMVAAIASVANTIYGNPTVTSAMIASTGLEPRKNARTQVVPKTPTGLVATAQENGQVMLKWDRSGNSQGVIFCIEVFAAVNEWRLLTQTTTTSIKLDGFEPGRQTFFRIYATKNGLKSGVSNNASIYGGRTATLDPIRVAA